VLAAVLGVVVLTLAGAPHLLLVGIETTGVGRRRGGRSAHRGLDDRDASVAVLGN
jgi:hypothetical protein